MLLSLVRTKSIGHIKDWRRLTVALSRGRLGLYVFGRRSLFEPSPSFAPLKDCLFPESFSKLLLNTEETFDDKIRNVEDVKGNWEVNSVEEIGNFVYDKSKSLPRV